MCETKKDIKKIQEEELINVTGGDNEEETKDNGGCEERPHVIIDKGTGYVK